MLESAGHTGDFRGLGTSLPRGLPPGRRYRRDFLDDRARCRQSKAKIFRRLFKKIERASTLVEVDVRRQDASLEVSRDRVEIVGR